MSVHKFDRNEVRLFVFPSRDILCIVMKLELQSRPQVFQA